MKKNLILFLFVFVLSCSDNSYYQDSNEVSEKESDVFFLDKKDALILAETMSNSFLSSSLKNVPVGNTYKKVKEITSIPDKNGKNAYYIINYIEGGFVVLSADKRTYPILAFSENSTMCLDISSLENNKGLSDWLLGQKEYVSSLRSNTKSRQNTLILDVWKDSLQYAEMVSHFVKPQKFNVSTKALIKDDDFDKPKDKGEPDLYEECGGNPVPVFDIGPLLNTKWGQGFGYNEFTPLMDCGRAPTGCVATAVAQVMKFHEHPTSYNWSLMENNRPTTETARLMADIGFAIGMKYSCSGSGAYSKDIPGVLKNRFGYYNSICYNYSVERLGNIIRSGNPAILSGGPQTGSGHAWVCDGFMQHGYHLYDCTFSVISYFHMNWGWSGTDDGWFHSYKWSVGNYDFNHNQKIITASP